MMKHFSAAMVLGLLSAAALSLCACSGTDGAAGAAGLDGTSCAAKAIKDTSGNVLGYTLACGADSASLTLDTLWNGTDGTGCSATPVVDKSKDTTGFVLVCGGTAVGVIADGTDGKDGTDGASCSAKALSDGSGYRLTCGDSSFTVLNGTDGSDGADGKDGADGTDGKSCTAAALADGSGYKLTCGDSSYTVLNGTDGTGCSVADTTDVLGVVGYKIVCGDTVKGVVWNGTDGASCSAKALSDGSGYVLTCGDSSFTVRNGAAGSDGADGKDGSDGEGCKMTAAGDSIVQVCGTDTLVTYKAWCGATHYDPTEKFCVGVTVYDLCDGKSYDLAEQYCLATKTGMSVQALLTDARDKQVYKTVKIGTQTWMAQNLNYADSASMANLAGNSWCYNNSADSCARYGRLYTWTGAMNIASSYQSASASAGINAVHQGACPVGWHVPTDAEWSTLATAVGGSSSAGTMLKSASGWNGTDDYGFSALPAGLRYSYGDFDYVRNDAFFWSATWRYADAASSGHLGFSASMLTRDLGKSFAFSVRCVQD